MITSKSNFFPKQGLEVDIFMENWPYSYNEYIVGVLKLFL